MKKLFLVNNKPDEPYFPASFKKTAEKEGYQLEELHVKDLSFYVDKDETQIKIYKGNEILAVEKDDLFFIRAWKPLVSTTALFCFVLDACNYKFSEREANTEHNMRGSKLAQCFILKPHNVRFPNSFVTTLDNVEVVYNTIQTLFTYPIVIKQSGSKGEKVWKCDTQAQLDAKIAELKETSTTPLILFQEYIENTFDIRVIVHHGTIIAAIARSAADGAFLNNLSQGGISKSIELTTEERSLALTAAKITKLELAGIDIVRSANGPLLFEVNKAPDISAFNEAAGFDIAQSVAEHFIRHA